jgi:hypothetical protein
MRTTTFMAGLLGAALAATCARAGTPAQETVRRLATVLRAEAPALSASTDSPLLSGQLAALVDGLKDLVRERTPREARAKAVEDAAAALRSEIDRAPKPLGLEFCRAAAAKVRSISGDALALATDEPASAPAVYAPVSAIFPPPDSAALAAFQRHAAAAGAAMDRRTFDGAAVAASPPPVPAPRPRPRRLTAREAKAEATRRLTAYQGALRAYLKASHRRPIEPDGIPGPATTKSVSLFQKKKGLRPTGLVDGATAGALFSDYQARRELPVTGELDAATAAALAKGDIPVYYAGKPEDFEATPKAATIKHVRATVYTPFLAKTRKERKLEGAPTDRHDQTVCTLERYVDGACPYVSVAIDSRLKVPNGTPLLIPEISALVGREIPFRIVDTGSLKRFKGTGHIDIATDSDQRTGIGRLISRGRITLVLPRGLHPTDL